MSTQYSRSRRLFSVPTLRGFREHRGLRRSAARLAESAPPPQIDTDRAVVQNRRWGRELGWQSQSPRVRNLLGLRSDANERDFAIGVLRWQRRQSGLAADGVLGPNTWSRMRVSLTGKPPIDVSRAVRLNTEWRRRLNWQACCDAVGRLIDMSGRIRGEREFASAAARWQRSQPGLLVDGIVGPQTFGRMQPLLANLAFLDADNTGSPVAMSEFPNDTLTLRRLEREVARERGGAERFTVDTFATPEGHERLTRDAATGIPGITPADLTALRDGVRRVDTGNPQNVFDAVEQRRHALRSSLCQRQIDAIAEIRRHLLVLFRRTLAAVTRTDRFQLLGESLHLIQDSYSNAHTERAGLTAGLGTIRLPAPIVYIRFFGLRGRSAPIEHRVFPPPDPRDKIAPSGTLTPFARAGISASRSYLAMMSGIPSGPPTPAALAALRAFMDAHLILHPAHTRTSDVYRGTCPP